jgi:hypothetical protein
LLIRERQLTKLLHRALNAHKAGTHPPMGVIVRTLADYSRSRGGTGT